MPRLICREADRVASISTGLKWRLRASTALTVALGLGAAGAGAATFNVASEAELAAAITAANSNAEADVINVISDVTLTGFLPVLDDPDGVTVDLGGNTVSGGGATRIFFVNGGTATIRNGTLADGLAQGDDRRARIARLHHCGRS